MTETAYFAAGCFWGVEQAFREIEGVTETQVGYTGGHSQNPTYEQVCAKNTGHAEAVKVVFDEALVSYERLLSLFWQIHNPTLIDRQGPDIGNQYRTAIFTTNDEQLEKATASREAEDSSGHHPEPIATQIEPLGRWNVAEEYHQQYFEKRGGGVCAISIQNQV